MIKTVLPAEWEDVLPGLKGASFLQTNQWARVKTETDWTASRIVWPMEGRVSGASLVLERGLRLGRLPLPIRILYLPRGPLADWSDLGSAEQALAAVEKLARQRKCAFLRIDPLVGVSRPSPEQDFSGYFAVNENFGQMLRARGWRVAAEQVQFRNTMLLDLKQDDEVLLARMKQKTRYNIRLAQRKGVSVRLGTRQDFDLLYRMYTETAVRDRFLIRPSSYYQRVWRTFMDEDACSLLIAEAEGEPVAGLVLFHYGHAAWYVYGMSRDLHRERMPNFLLQWEAMRLARSKGAEVYDLWGAPDEPRESDPMWGVYRFKEGLGASFARSWGAWDFVVSSGLYRMYTQLIPRLLSILRRRTMKKQLLEAGG